MGGAQSEGRMTAGVRFKKDRIDTDCLGEKGSRETNGPEQ